MRVGGGAKSHACRGWGQESCVQGVGPGVMRAGGGRPEPYMQGVGPARSHVCRGWGQLGAMCAGGGARAMRVGGGARSHVCRGWGQE